MTRAERKIAAAERRVKVIEAKMAAAAVRHREAVRKLDRAYWSRRDEMERERLAARIKAETLRLAAIGVEPGKTVLTWLGNPYHIRFSSLGYPRMVRLTKSGRPSLAHNDICPPYRDVFLNGETVKL